MDEINYQIKIRCRFSNEKILIVSLVPTWKDNRFLDVMWNILFLASLLRLSVM